jgi:flavorubredoxin
VAAECVDDLLDLGGGARKPESAIFFIFKCESTVCESQIFMSKMRKHIFIRKHRYYYFNLKAPFLFFYLKALKVFETFGEDTFVLSALNC